MIDNSEDRVVSIGLGETDYKVHSYLLEWEGGWICGDFVHRWASAVGDDLILLTRHAALYVFCDPSAHVGPPVISLGLSDGLVASGVSGYETLVYHSHDFPFDRKVRGNRQLSVFPPA